MKKPTRKSTKKIGLAPGTLVYVGEERTEKAKITILDYDADHLDERVAHSAEECYTFAETPTTTWMNIEGLHNVELIEKIGKHFNLDYLILEDIVNTNQRPKLEDHGTHLFIVLRIMYFDRHNNEIVTEQASIIMGRNFVASFVEKEGEIFNHVRERLRKGGKRIRTGGPDYLAYALVDTVVDGYFAILDILSERLEEMQEQLLDNPTPEALNELHRLKRDLVMIRKSALPLRELLMFMERTESPLISDNTFKYIRDAYDHAIQVIESIESTRDMLSTLFDIYLSSISNKMNEVMKVLTIIATLFIPMTFIAGIYGMNFVYMPELSWPWGYALAWILMLCVGGLLLTFFKRKKWL